MIRLSQINEKLAEKRDTLGLSAFGKTVAGGLVIICAAGVGSAVAEEIGHKLGGEITLLVGGIAAAARNGARSAAFFSVLASGVTGIGSSLAAIARSDRLAVTFGHELQHSFKAGFRALSHSGLTALAAAFLGGSGAAVMAVGLPATIGAGLGGVVASSVGAVITVGLTATLDYPMRAGRARARRAQAIRKQAVMS